MLMRRITEAQETAVIAAGGITYWFGWCSLVWRFMRDFPLVESVSLWALWSQSMGVMLAAISFLWLGQYPWRVAVHLYRRHLQPHVLRKEEEGDGRDGCSDF